jgi:hypothetical protein
MFLTGFNDYEHDRSQNLTIRFVAGADLVQRLVHYGHDVEAVEDVQRLGTLLADHIQVGLP